MATRRVAAGAAALLAALALAGLLAGVAVAATSQTSPAPGQGSGVSTTSVTTSRNVLDGSPTSAATTTTAVSVGVAGSSSGKASTSVNYKIWAVVAALVVVALLIAWWTVRYWRATDPRGARSPTTQDRLRERDKPRKADKARGRTGGGPDGDGARSRDAHDETVTAGERSDGSRRKRSKYSDLVITVPHPDDHDA